MFELVNAGKKSITLNLKSTEGKAIFVKLLEKADVLVEVFVQASCKGLGYENVCAIKKDMIYLSLTGYGQQGLTLFGQVTISTI